MDLLITHLSEVATPLGREPRRGAEQSQIRRQKNVEVLCQDRKIAFVGTPRERERVLGELPDTPRLNANGGTLVPGFVDPHTHLPWAGSREEEFAMRLAGKTYMEIAAAGGGILSTVRSTRGASEDELIAGVDRRLRLMLRHGTTTAETKSGYGLNLEDELKQLRTIQDCSERPGDVPRRAARSAERNDHAASPGRLRGHRGVPAEIRPPLRDPARRL